MVSTRSGRTLSTDVHHGNEATSTATAPRRHREDARDIQSREHKDTVQPLDKSPSGTLDSLANSLGSLQSPKKKSAKDVQRRVSDVDMRDSLPDVQESPDAGTKTAKEVEDLAKIPLSDDDEMGSNEKDVDSLEKEEEIVPDASNEVAAGVKVSKKKKRSTSGFGVLLLTSGLFMGLAVATWQVLCGPTPLSMLPRGSLIMVAVAPACVTISSRAEASWFELQYAWDNVVDAAKESAEYYNQRFQDLISPAAPPPSVKQVQEEYPLTFRTWMTDKTFKELLPSGMGWEDLVDQFYQYAKHQATEKGKAASVVLSCSHFSVCKAATSLIRASIVRNVPGCIKHVELGSYLNDVDTLQADLGHQIGGCPNSVIIVSEANRATAAVVSVLNNLTAEQGSIWLDDHAVPASGIIVMMMYETFTPAPSTIQDSVTYAEEIKNQVQGDMEALVGDFDSSKVAWQFRQQIDWVAPLK